MLEIKKIYKQFNNDIDNPVNVFKNFSLTINTGEVVAILGPNGCGKSTLFNMISGSINQDKGDILLNGKLLNSLKENECSKHIAKVYQNPSMGVSPSLTVLENMAIADKKGKTFTLSRLVNKNRIEEYKNMLKKLNLGLEDRLHTKVKYLSGGQRQSLSLLMSTMKNPELLLLDEHTAALDPKTSKVVLKKTIDVVKKFNITTMMISHNIHDSIKYSDRIIMLNKGNIVLDIESNKITEEEIIRYI